MGCKKLTETSDNTGKDKAQLSYFSQLDLDRAGIDFINTLDEERATNPYNYINLYSGAGLAIGDINNDGLQDIFFAANMTSSRLYLNKGNLEFEDITESSGVATRGWCTAVTMADINNDGLLDIYVCRAYHDNPDDRRNLAFINQGDNKFREMGSQLNIADENYSIASSFFDYDRDGDLDLVVGNHPRYLMMPAKVHYEYWLNPVLQFSNRLFRNDGDRFTDVTAASGLMSYGHTLGLSTSDYNVDGFPDIFITVDHAEPDYIFENNGDGTFTNVVGEIVGQTSKSSMGIDVGDVNHDVYPDFFVSEMLSEDHFREKVHMDMTNIDRFHFFVDSMHYKYYQMHNFLYLNNGNNSFSDIAQMAGVHKSDWSWSNLFMDFDNDGWQDLFVSNGYYKHIFQKDFKKQLDKKMLALGNDMAAKNRLAQQMTKTLPVDKIPNYLFRNTGNLEFEIYTEQAGLNVPTVSTGASYGDLDNDGDLDLVVSNINESPMIFENKSKGHNHLRVTATSDGKVNPMGARVYMTIAGETQSRELITTRGFLSSSEPYAHFGTGTATSVDKLEFIWPDGRKQVWRDLETNLTIIANYKDADKGESSGLDRLPALAQIVSASELGINYIHSENPFRDFDIQILLPHKQSEYGPHVAVADVNGDGLDDIYLPGPHQQMGRLYFQTPERRFEFRRQQVFFDDRYYEDGKCSFVDIDADGDPDLLVSSSGYEFEEGSELYKSRIYINNGRGQFANANSIKGHQGSASCIKPADIDGDGDLDIFIGGRLKPHAYPDPGTSGLLINNNGQFENRITEWAPELEHTGMVHDACWTDIDSDGDLDLLVVGEWMPISVWINEDNRLVNRTSAYFETPLTGWWNTIEQADLDGDGQNEFVIGNLGLNYKYKASKEKPFTVYAKDIDQNGTYDIVLGTYYGDQLFPVRGKTCSTQQLPEFKQVYQTYTQYASLELEELYGDRLDGAIKYEVNEFASGIIKLGANGKFDFHALPLRAQMAPINGIVIMDIDKDGRQDLVVAGNLYQSEIETGRADSGTGVVLMNNGSLKFEALDVMESGVYLPDDVKSLASLSIGGTKAVIAGINGGIPKVLMFRDLNIQ